MRKLLLLPLLALLAAPLPAAAQSGSQLFCFANDTLVMLFRVKIIQITADGREAVNDWTNVPGKSRHCERFVRPHAVRFEVENRNGGWESSTPCNRTITRPSGGAVLRTTGTVLSFNCAWE
ncbi:hypothetical protein KTR66_01900 [Roseococcus sp. SDR]|uniref:hypothetical protein n=1 Tax=Roseococcus sp. SDR TaxID=2835532 RepID=UPI001BCE84BB|nr:hypothetical protein [Roseococcus sp. SDR]MBS7788727.1 hypothetical protein [Roseococcus sp. SDR]MBV1844041.1 hypothetical protein [Roseococcus sp. SDR]